MTQSKYNFPGSLRPDICKMVIDFAVHYEEQGFDCGALFLPGHYFGAIVEASTNLGSPFIKVNQDMYQCGILDLYHCPGIVGDKIFAAGTDESNPDDIVNV